MHSFDNGTALKAKKDNWYQLLKLFRKVGIADVLNEEQLNWIICLEDGAAAGFICRLYEVLTQRKVQMQVKRPTIGKVAGYTKDIGLTRVRKELRKNDLRDDSDILTVSRMASSVLGEHHRSLQEERISDPDRFSTASITGNRLSPGAPQSMAESSAELPQVKVKEIQVRQLDRNVTQLRASNAGGKKDVSPGRGDGAKGPRPLSPTGNDYGERGGVVQGQGGILAENALSALNTCISRVMTPGCFPGYNYQIDPYQNFFTALSLLSRSKDYDNLVATTLTEIKFSAQTLAGSCVATPKQFWKVADLFVNTLAGSAHNSESYECAVDAFVAIGNAVTQKDSHSSLAMFCDFALFKVSHTITSNPHKRVGILRIMHAFTPSDTQSHVQCIKRLQAIVTDLGSFVHCLTILAAQETRMDDMLLDLYLYYANIGLSLPNPKLRAAIIAMLATLLPIADQMIHPMLPQLEYLAETETWWETQVNLLSFCGALLESERNRKGYESIESGSPTKTSTDSMDNSDVLQYVIQILDLIFHVGAPKHIKMWGLFALSAGSAVGEPVVSYFLRIMDSLNNEDRQFLLDLTGDTAVAGPGSRIKKKGMKV